ncbi:phage minor head protein [Kordiimonas marina]|uniref:phage minor head protein n=1 Tax=Kordiimonas marina TaxID=2872312 RepID=UPI001FF517E7|nr:phage minor head protein [Kordiimonas marina]MCJ9428554.1 hypothetical protein [Kordiimonas marina]
MTPSERRAAFEKAKRLQLKELIQANRDTAAEVQALLKQAKAELQAILRGAPTDFQAFQLPQLNRSIDGVMAEIETALSRHAGERATTAHAMGQALIDKPIQAAGINIAAFLPEVDTRQLIAIRNFMTDRLKAATIDAAASVRASLGLVVIGSKTHSEAVADVAHYMETTRSRAWTIVRTEVGRAYATASQERKMMASAYLPGLKKQWRRSGKIHSRKAHDAADGQIVPVEQPFIIDGHKLMHPRDPAAPASETINCGCLSLPIMDHWQVRTPGRQAFTQEELKLNPFKRDLAAALGSK